MSNNKGLHGTSAGVEMGQDESLQSMHAGSVLSEPFRRSLGGDDAPSTYFASVGSRRGRYAFSFADWQILTGPLVYAWVDRREVLYIGMSTHGFRRILSLRHEAFTRFPQWAHLQPRQGMRLYVWPVNTGAEARTLERKLIRRHAPLLNRADKPPQAPPRDWELQPDGKPLARARWRLERRAQEQA